MSDNPLLKGSAINISRMMKNVAEGKPFEVDDPDLDEAVWKPMDSQIGGDHYKKLKIQPIEYIHANNIPYFEGNVIKYVSRWRSKNGLADLEKAKHYLELLIELETRRGRET